MGRVRAVAVEPEKVADVPLSVRFPSFPSKVQSQLVLMRHGSLPFSLCPLPSTLSPTCIHTLQTGKQEHTSTKFCPLFASFEMGED